jgi:hypothetical protein
MRILAIILSPLLVVIIAWISYNILFQHTELWFLLIQIGTTYFVTIIIQILVEIILLILKLWFTIDFEIYIKLACISCLFISVIIFLITLSTNKNFMNSFFIAFETFIFLLIYSIGNSLTYNYLYFKRLEKE